MGFEPTITASKRAKSGSCLRQLGYRDRQILIIATAKNRITIITTTTTKPNSGGAVKAHTVGLSGTSGPQESQGRRVVALLCFMVN
jgi:hypothetical protein